MDKLSHYKVVAQDLIEQLISGSSDMTIDPIWASMKVKDREVFAQTFFNLSKNKILQGELKAVEVFEIAKRIAPLSASLEYQQAVFWFDYAIQSNHEKYLLLAVKHIKHAIDIDPNFFDAWYAWGDILVHLGLAYHEAHYFQEADEKFQQALPLLTNPDKYLAKFYWDWGLCWYFLAKHSGEAIDIRVALQKFNESYEQGLNQGVFFRDYGNCWVEMGILIKDDRCIHKAIEFYKKSVEIEDQYFDGWLSLAQAYHHLFEMNRKDAYLAQAHEIYTKASEFQNVNLDLWLCWGRLFLSSGKQKKESKHLQMSAMKFAKALSMSPSNPEAISLWGESLVLIGAYTFRLDLLRQGEKKLLEAIEMLPDSPDIWNRYAYCLYSQGQYFEDVDYFSQALEKYQYAISLDPNHYASIYGLALTYFALANLKMDSTLFEQAEEYFIKAIKLNDKRSEVYNDWGLLLMRLAEITDEESYAENATLQFEKAVDLQKDQPETEYLYNYGCALDFLGCFKEEAHYHEKAARVLSHVLYVDPEYKQVRYNLALVFSHLGEITEDIDYFTKAIAQFKLVVEEDSEDEMTWNEWGQTLLYLAQILYDPSRGGVFHKVLEEAEKKLKKAASLGSLRAFYNLACLFSLAGQFEESLYYLRQAEAKDALPPLDELLEDSLLESVRKTEAFQKFFQELTLKHRPRDLDGA